MKPHTILRAWSVAQCLLIIATHAAMAQGTAFTYQGRLSDGANPASGLYDLRFALYDNASAGTQRGGALTNAATAVSNGLFTVALDFGNQFPGAGRWLEIEVRTNGSGTFTTLAPRQPLAATPYAVMAGNLSGPVAASQLTGAISSSNLAAGSITAAQLAPGAVGSNQLATNAVTSAALADGAVTTTKLATTLNVFHKMTLTNPVPESGSSVGSALAALGGDRIVLGGYDVAYLYSVDGAVLTTFTNPMPGSANAFGYPVRALGTDRVLIGASDDYDIATNSAVYLFSTNGALLATFTNPTPATREFFASALAAVGTDRVLIGAQGDSTGATNSGAAYLFNTNGTLLLTLTNPTPAASDFFGATVMGLGNDRLVIGATGDDVGATNAGVVHLFSTNGTLLLTMTNPAAQPRGFFGLSLATLGGDRLIVGAVNQAFLMSTNGLLLATFTDPAPSALTLYGHTVAALGNDYVVLGAPDSDVGATNRGAAYVFSTSGTLLLAITNPLPVADENFGLAMAALGNDQIVIAGNGPNPSPFLNPDGVAFVYGMEHYVAGLLADTLRAGAVGTDALANGAVTADKIGGVLRLDQIPALDTSRIPDLDASKITSGTLADARLSAYVAMRFGAQTFSGANSFINTNNYFVGSGFGLTLLNAGNLINMVPLPSLPGEVVTNNEAGVALSGSFAGHGGGLTNLNAAGLAAGTLADARLSTNVALRAGGNAFSGNQVFTNGSLGLGTNNPSATLDVNGTFRAGFGTTIFKNMQGGLAQMSSGSSTAKTNFIFAFPRAFTSVPNVILSARSGNVVPVDDTFAVTVRDVTVSNCTVNVVRVDASIGWSQFVKINWFAWE